MCKHRQHLQTLYETPALREEDFDRELTEQRIEKVEAIFQQADQENRVILTEFESKAILEAYDIPTVKTVCCVTEEEACQAAKIIGFPVVLKLHSKTITHKTDVGGVKLNIRTLEEVKKAYQEIKTSVTRLHTAEDFDGVVVQSMISLRGHEILIGSMTDEQFGPILVFAL